MSQGHAHTCTDAQKGHAAGIYRTQDQEKHRSRAPLAAVSVSDSNRDTLSAPSIAPYFYRMAGPGDDWDERRYRAKSERRIAGN